jgi:apolipoprotein N-acyltransferase
MRSRTSGRIGVPQSEGTARRVVRNPKSIRIALIQGNSEPEWKHDPSREQQIMDEYIALSGRAVELADDEADSRPLDLVVWPETTFRRSLFSFDPGFRMPPAIGITAKEIAAMAPADLANLVARLKTPVLVGVDRVHVPSSVTAGIDEQMLRIDPPPLSFNSAALVGRDGKIIGTYDKLHRVMFGEYIPFADRLPFLYQLTPLTGGIQPGTEAAGLELDGVTYAPNICYETAIPHVIRGQVASLADRGQSPDVLVNLTNDAWYWGSSELDMHLACGVFRAIEARRPLVIAANGGISAWIDAFGHIRAQLPRQQADVLIADVELNTVRSWYMAYGDWFAGACLACCVGLAIIGWRGSRSPTSDLRPPTSDL